MLSPELITALLTIAAGGLVGAIPAVVGWLANRGKVTADSSSVLVSAATSAAKELLVPLTESVKRLEAQLLVVRQENLAMQGVIDKLRSERNSLQLELDTANSRISTLEQEVVNLSHDNALTQEKYAQREAEFINCQMENKTLSQHNLELANILQQLSAESETRLAQQRKASPPIQPTEETN
jgi:chromosome segregation ATPase